MSGNLKSFKIEGLHGYKTVEVEFTDNILIIVGENGSGKTTFLRILFHFLSGRWFSLVQFKFNHIVANIDGVEYKIRHQDLSRSFAKSNRHYLSQLPASIRGRIIRYIETGEADSISALELHRICDSYGVSLSVIRDSLERLDDEKDQKENFDKK